MSPARVLTLVATIFSIQTPLVSQNRIRDPIDENRRTTLRGSLHPLARPELDRGRVPPATSLKLATLLFTRTPAQQADLDALLARQQDPSSVDYRRWLTPRQFAERFGISRDDARIVTQWLQSEGLTIERVGRGGSWISFSGSVQQVERTFRTEIHQYKVNGRMHLAPAREPSVPAALQSVAAGVVGLDDFHLEAAHLAPRYTLANGTHGLSPDDFGLIYDALLLYSAGVDGGGQTIAIVGQSNVNLDDIRRFRSYFGLSPNDPQVVVYGPDPGIDPAWEFEEDLDLEWAGAVARNARIILVEASDALTATQFAVDDDIAPVISFSAGDCEQKFPNALPLLGRTIAEQANAEGITWLTASGDSGAAACEGHTDSIAATTGKAVAFPASIPEVTAVGGTEFNEAGGRYWSQTNRSDSSSALSYIPEAAWNDSAIYGFPFGGGGGASALFAKPAWQVGLGVPDDGARDVPDVSFPASGAHDPYMIFWHGAQAIAGGASAGPPTVAGVLALLNQYLLTHGLTGTPGLGNINPALYRLAQRSPASFHDITTGDNNVPCVIGTPDCTNGTLGYSAGKGYDQATGLGSIDIFNFIANWNPSGEASSLTLRSSAATVPMSSQVILTATVTTFEGRPIASGQVSFLAGVQSLGTAALDSGGTASLELSAGQLKTGAHTITAVYGGDSRLNGSTGSAAVTVTLPAANSAVVPTLTPNPAYQSVSDANGAVFTFTITLHEMAGVDTKLTDFTINGVSQAVSSVFTDPAIPANGIIMGTIRLTPVPVPAVVVFGVSGRDASGFQWTQRVSGQLFGPAYRMIVNGVGNSASGSLQASPGMAASAYGSGLASGTLSAAALPLPLSLSTTTATVNGVIAPLYFVSDVQVNFQVPYGIASGTAVLEIGNSGQKSTYAFTVNAASPGIFTDTSGSLLPFPSGSPGQVLTMFITGEGAVSPVLATGATPSADIPVTQLPAPVQHVTLTIGGAPATIDFIGIPHGLAGVTQINFTVPQDLPAGPKQVVVTVGGVASRAAVFTVRP